MCLSYKVSLVLPGLNTEIDTVRDWYWEGKGIVFEVGRYTEDFVHVGICFIVHLGFSSAENCRNHPTTVIV